MTPPADWDLSCYCSLLLYHARDLRLDPRLCFSAEDVVQETLKAAHQGLPQFRGATGKELEAWLLTILARTAIDMIRHGRAKKHDFQLEQSIQATIAESSARLGAFLAANQSSPSQQAERNEELLRLARALEELPEDQRTAIIQRHLKGRPVEEIAQNMVPPRTEKAVRGLLARGRAALRNRLQ
jgi:RNA polymerase sigma-70 factor, ECF subfamily